MFEGYNDDKQIKGVSSFREVRERVCTTISYV
jgi:hypothetical protein